jgi:hypothetical protein
MTEVFGTIPRDSAMIRCEAFQYRVPAITTAEQKAVKKPVLSQTTPVLHRYQVIGVPVVVLSHIVNTCIG